VAAKSRLAPLLPSGEVHVWRTRLEPQAGLLAAMTNSLSRDELERAAAFRTIVDRDRFVLRRGFLRAVLARYLAIGPSDVRFSYGRYLKPFVDPAYHKSALSFNVTHRRDIALAVVTATIAVGIDIEIVEPLSDLESLAARFLSEREQKFVDAVADAERTKAFLTAWTRKEAYLKALGDGLVREPKLIDVRLDRSPTTELREFDHRSGREELWRVETVVPVRGYVGAVVGRGTGWRIRWMDWPAGPAPC